LFLTNSFYLTNI